MIEYQDKYIEDAGELIASLELQLMHFEKNSANEEIIREIFRVMHTLKGSAGMFGFKKIAGLTHVLEDIYDSLRNKETTVSKAIVDITFQSVDIIKELLYSKEQINDSTEKRYQLLLNSLASPQPQDVQLSETMNLPQSTSGIYLYFIHYKPNPDVLLRGVKPMAVFDELAGLGRFIQYEYVDTTVDMLETNHNFNLSWDIFLITTQNDEAIYDVFLFFSENEYKIQQNNDFEERNIKKFISQAQCIVSGIKGLNDLYFEICTIIAETPVDILVEEQPTTTVVLENQHLTVYSDDTIRVPASRLDNLLTLVSDLIIIHSQFENHAKRLNDATLLKSVKEHAKISKNFRDNILSTRLLPLNTIMVKLQRLVRDLSQQLNKPIEFIIEGANTELDKNIINKIEAPLMHIIRNCIDHGIEDEHTRSQNYKTVEGVIRFIAFYSGTNVFIQIQDDGKGIDTDYILMKAKHKGLIRNDEQLTKNQIYELLFLPGFTTTDSVSEISGRGVGLDVVKKEITDLHGEVSIESEIGLGTSFTIKLPLTLSIIDALLVRCVDFKLLIPLNNIVQCKIVDSEKFDQRDLKIEFNNKFVPVIRIKDFMLLQSAVAKKENLIIISIYDKQYGLLVDEITNTIQAVVKPLGHFHKNQEYFTGVSVLGDGSLAYILDLNHLIKSNFINRNQ